eukprot:6197078-Pleurochrysis_carterae.AAC.4
MHAVNLRSRLRERDKRGLLRIFATIVSKYARRHYHAHAQHIAEHNMHQIPARDDITISRAAACGLISTAAYSE